MASANASADRAAETMLAAFSLAQAEIAVGRSNTGAAPAAGKPAKVIVNRVRASQSGLAFGRDREMIWRIGNPSARTHTSPVPFAFWSTPGRACTTLPLARRWVAIRSPERSNAYRTAPFWAYVSARTFSAPAK